MADQRERWLEARLFAAVFLIACLLGPTQPADNENRTLDLTRALAAGRLWIDPDAANTGDKSWVPAPPPTAALSLGAVSPEIMNRGHFYAASGPGLAFALLPFYVCAQRLVPSRLLLFVLTIVGAALPLALGSVGVKRAVERSGVPPDEAFFAGALHGLATIGLTYGTRLFADSLTVALLAWSLALVLGCRARRRGLACALAGFLASVAVATHYSAVVPATFLGALALLEGGVAGLAAFAAGAVPIAAALAWYQASCFGSPFSNPYKFLGPPPEKGERSAFFAGFLLPQPKILFASLFGLKRGFLVTQPIVLVGLAGLVARARRARSLLLCLVAVAVVLLVVACRPYDWWGGVSFGLRYAIGALPFVSLGYSRGLSLVGRARGAIVGSSLAAAFVGASCSWPGREARTALETFLLFGPRTPGVSGLLLGTGPAADPGALPTLVVAGVTLAVGLAVGAALLLPRARGAHLVALALAPPLVCGSVALRHWVAGPAAFSRQAREIARRDTGDLIRELEQPAGVRVLLSTVTSWRDPELMLVAAERLVELEPANADARALRDSLRPGR